MVLNDPSAAFIDRIARRSSRGGFTEVYDKTLQDTGFTIQNTAFDTDNVIIYDVRGMYAFFIQLFNPSVSLTLSYELQFATTEIPDPTNIAEADWFDLIASTDISSQSWSNSTVAPSGNNISEFIRASSKMTFFRIRLKMSSATATTITGIFSGV